MAQPGPPPEFIYFDLGNVLLHFDHGRACQQLALTSGCAESDVRALMFDSGLQWRYERGEIDTSFCYELFCERTGTRPDYAAFRRAAGEIFTPNLSLTPLVAQLRHAGHRLGILSNTCEVHWAHAFGTLIGRYFHHYALSFELNAAKPEADIYIRAAELAGVAPERIFFVDDRPENVAGARTAGLDAVVFESTEHLAKDLRRRGLQFNY